MNSSALLACLAILLTPDLSRHQGDSSQQDKAAPTKLDAFVSTKGVLIVQDSLATGTIDGPKEDSSFIFIAAISAYEPGSKDKTKGLQCTIHRVLGGGLSDSDTCSIDVEEAQSLSSALDYLLKLATEWKGVALGEHAERHADFVTASSFRVGISVSDKATVVQFTASVGRIGPTRIRLVSLERVGELKRAIDEGLVWLARQ